MSHPLNLGFCRTRPTIKTRVHNQIRAPVLNYVQRIENCRARERTMMVGALMELYTPSRVVFRKISVNVERASPANNIEEAVDFGRILQFAQRRAAH